MDVRAAESLVHVFESNSGDLKTGRFHSLQKLVSDSHLPESQRIFIKRLTFHIPHINSQNLVWNHAELMLAFSAEVLSSMDIKTSVLGPVKAERVLTRASTEDS